MLRTRFKMLQQKVKNHKLHKNKQMIATRKPTTTDDIHPIRTYISNTNLNDSLEEEFRLIVDRFIKDPDIIDQLVRSLNKDQIKEFVFYFESDYRNKLQKLGGQRYSVERLVTIFKDLLNEGYI